MVGLIGTIANELTDTLTGRNTRHGLGALWPSHFRLLAVY